MLAPSRLDDKNKSKKKEREENSNVMFPRERDLMAMSKTNTNFMSRFFKGESIVKNSVNYMYTQEKLAKEEEHPSYQIKTKRVEEFSMFFKRNHTFFLEPVLLFSDKKWESYLF